MVEEDFFMKNYKKSENRGHFEFFRSRKKKSLTIMVNFLELFLYKQKL